jgi:lipopolysaccharide heptosyltransferase II
MSDVARLPLCGPVRRILVLRPRALGDVLLATPALRALKAGFPGAELHVAVDDLLMPLLQRNPHVDRLWPLPRRRPRRLRDWWRLAVALARSRFDLVIDLHGSPRTALLARITGAPNRVGYALRGRGRLYNLRLPRDADRAGRRRALYAARTNLEIVARCGALGPALEDTSLVLAADPQAEASMDAWLRAAAPAAPRVGLVPAGTWPAKTWPARHWAQCADALAARGATVILLWGPGEFEVAAAVRSQMQQPAVIPPPTDLDALLALVGRLDLLVCHDSGVKHVAVARGTPTLTLYGPTNPVAWSPESGPHAGLAVQVPCLACNRRWCTHGLCMRLLPPAAVAARALELLAERPMEARR